MATFINPSATDRHTNFPNRETNVGVHTLTLPDATATSNSTLPAVDWLRVGKTPPSRIHVDERKPEDRLPLADAVVLTWTSAEWFALGRVFLNSDQPGDFATDHEWKRNWRPYRRGATDFVPDKKSGELWGLFQLVEITDFSGRPWRVLLFKSNSHLAHPPWIQGLSKMIDCILEDTDADRIFTIGTAGGARLDQKLGDSVITNSALLDLIRPENTSDPDNGNMYRCPTWFPATGLLKSVEDNLLFRMDRIVTRDSLGSLFEQFQSKHSEDATVAQLKLDDLLNDALRPEKLSTPKVQVLKDIPLLTTDFYYIAGADSADAYAFLEMDDAIIARQANKRGAKFACIRNISDPVMRKKSDTGTPLSDLVRSEWSGLIYNTFGLHTSYNSALATWAVIAGEGEAGYNPPRETAKASSADPLEVNLVYRVRSCGSCDFFWPKDKHNQPYGPYTAFDFDVNVPYEATAEYTAGPQRWVTGRTRPPAFPNGEVSDGCRKAPIMTIGINPNMTAFSPGQTGAAWTYPNFSSDNDTDAWIKYAWYYRYRTVYQERLSLDFIRRFILPDGQIIASRCGHVVTAKRPTDSPNWSIAVRYDGDPADTVLEFPGNLGDFPYMMLFDPFPPNNKFKAGDVIAGRLAVPQGIQVDVLRQEQGYYMQFVPVLKQFQDILRNSGHRSAELRIGEDVSQLDMVACASPHWNKGFLGGSNESINQIVENCVAKNAWAIQQLVQTRPAVLFIVSQSSWNMFYSSLGAHVQRDQPLAKEPEDSDFTLLRQTTDPDHPTYFEFNSQLDGKPFHLRTRIVITPHFSYDTNFLKQFRFPLGEWEQIQSRLPNLKATLTTQNGFTTVEPEKGHHAPLVIQLSSDPTQASKSIDMLRAINAWDVLEPYFYDPHSMMTEVLEEMFKKGDLIWQNGPTDDSSGYLARTEGSCHFCVNAHWQFPNGCRYGKTKLEPPPPGFLEKVAQQLVATGKPTDTQPNRDFSLNGPLLHMIQKPCLPINPC